MASGAKSPSTRLTLFETVAAPVGGTLSLDC